jgi:hypothetical protein
VPAAFVAGSLLLMANALVETPALTAVSFGIILSGIPVYIAWRPRDPK